MSKLHSNHHNSNFKSFNNNFVPFSISFIPKLKIILIFLVKRLSESNNF